MYFCKIEPTIEEIMLKFAQMQRAINIADAVAKQLNWDPVIEYSSASNGGTCSVIRFKMRDNAEIFNLLRYAEELAGSSASNVSESDVFLSICPDDGDFRCYRLNCTKNEAVKYFIKRQLGLAPSDVFTLGSWIDWKKQKDEEVIANIVDRCSQLIDIIRISNKLAEKVRKEIDVQFESFTGWKNS